jgi:heme-degrading monooxygenase HmoA
MGEPRRMIVETALFTVRDGDQALFSRTFASARRFIETAKGFRKLEMHQGIEAPDTFILIVWWETLEDHTVAFKESANFTGWRAEIGHLFAAPPVVRHYAVDGPSGRQVLDDLRALAPDDRRQDQKL